MKSIFKKIPKSIFIIFYPIFISILLEYNTCQNIIETFKFIISKPNIFLFNIFLTCLLFGFIFLITKKAHIAMIIHGGIFYILSCVEYFKYKTSGSHLVISDLLMTKNLNDVGKFASIKLTFPIILNFIILTIFIYIIYKKSISISLSKKQRLYSSLSIIGITTMFFATPVSSTVFSAFEIENSVATNILESNKQFSDIGFLPYLAQTTSQQINSNLEEPENYSEETVNSYISKEETSVNENSKKPNVIFIMSESYSDFRVFNSLNINEDIYKNYDEVADEGYLGHALVPTFGGYTTRTEFELLFGLPTLSLNTPSVPQNLIKGQDTIETIPSYFKSLGYNTTYIHPFSGSFYDRSNLYSEYGFDNLYFEGNLTVPEERYRRYISDQTVFEQIKKQLQSDESPSYIFATTMQNHQPYYEDEAEGADQLNYYLQGIKETNKTLREFTNWLKDFDEDVILVFVGDHFPFFTPDDNVYDRLGISNNNANLIYNQNYLIWDNYNCDMSNIIDKDISSFYIPYVLLDLLNIKKTSWTNTMIESLNECAIYSPSDQSLGSKNEKLDILTYDRVIGDCYSIK